MATIAKGSITLVNVNDAYSVLLTPDSCAIKADYDGTNPDLSNAFTDITVVRGEEKQTFKLTLSSFSNSSITYQQTAIDGYTKRILLTSIPSDVLSGALTFTITTDDEFVADVTFTYSVIRETSMLDWILDWESNKTVIGDTYLITPKIFVGKKVENEEGLNTLTGVYIGPDDTNTAGIYGYKEGEDIFHINANGAMIGGWSIDQGGISTSNEYGTLQILSSGIIGFDDVEGERIWMLGQDGEAEFAKGNVVFSSNGDAYFDGEIQAAKGQIGGWTIGENALTSSHIAFNSADNCIAVCSSEISDASDLKTKVSKNGGVYMYYDNANSYGIVGYGSPTRVGDLYRCMVGFSVGSTNIIGGWSFDNQALWRGIRINTSSAYTKAAGDITIGTNGLRGNSWYINSDGTASFASGNVQFTETSGSIVGWNLNERRLSNPNMALVSDTANAGIYMSVAEGTDFDNLASSSLTDYIDSNGGIYMKIKTDGVSFAAYDSNGKKIFKLRSSGVSSIADWNIENDALFVGEKKLTADTFTDASGSMTFGDTGIRGYKWRLESDGSGAIAGGNIKWDEDGVVEFSDSVSLYWKKGIDEVGLAADIAQKMAFGKMLFRDPEFTGTDFNGTNLYPYNTTTGTQTIVEDSTAPNGTQRVMALTSNSGWVSDTDRRVVGFYFANQSRAGAKFVVKIVAKIPKSLFIFNYHNDYGDGGSTQWLTSQQGTGEYTEYLCLVTCGASGTFSTINHFALTTTFGTEETLPPVTWYVAYATVFDISSSDKFTTTIDVNGIYTGTLRADQIVAGTIDTSLINADELLSNGNAWALKQDGSGYLASKNIQWDIDGSLQIKGTIEALSGKIGKDDNAFIINENGLSYGDISSWALDSTHKALFTPESLRIQNQDSELNGSFHRVAFGNGADPSVANQFGTVAFVHRHDKSSTYWNAFNPAMRVYSMTNWGNGIAIQTDGAIIANNGPIAEKATLLTTTSSLTSLTKLDVLNGSVFIIKNDIENAAVYLPEYTLMRYMFQDTDGKNNNVYRIRVVSCRDNQIFKVYVGISDNNDTKLYDRLQEVGSYSVYDSDIIEFIMVKVGATKYWQVATLSSYYHS